MQGGDAPQHPLEGIQRSRRTVLPSRDSDLVQDQGEAVGVKVSNHSLRWQLRQMAVSSASLLVCKTGNVLIREQLISIDMAYDCHRCQEKKHQVPRLCTLMSLPIWRCHVILFTSLQRPLTQPIYAPKISAAAVSCQLVRQHICSTLSFRFLTA